MEEITVVKGKNKVQEEGNLSLTNNEQRYSNVAGNNSVFASFGKGRDSIAEFVTVESSLSFEPPNFQAPQVVEININAKTNRRPKKRSFKSREDQQSFSTFINQMSTINYRLCDVIAPSKGNNQYGKVLFPYGFTKYFEIQDDQEPNPIRIHVLSKHPIATKAGYAMEDSLLC